VPDVTVELLTSSIAQLQNRGLELGNLPRNGQVVEARVIALLKDGMARLTLMGQTIDVSAPSTLQPGTSISVAVVRDGANLKLVMQQDAQAAPQQAPVASAPALKADPAAFLPAAVKAAIIGALLDSLNTGTPSAERTGSPPQSPPAPAAPGAPTASAAPPAEAAPAPGAGPQATAQTQHGVGTTPQGPGLGNDPRPASPSVSSSAPSSAHAAPQPAGLPGDASSVATQNSAPAILVPFQLPQLAQPLMLRVEQHEEDGTDDSGGPAAKRAWTVSVSLDAGALGLIHAGIGIRQGEVSVRFSAKDPQGAAHLSAWLPELKKSLEQADFVAGELSAAVTLQADPAAGQGRSYTV
jgi:hypothetical protein